MAKKPAKKSAKKAVKKAAKKAPAKKAVKKAAKKAVKAPAKKAAKKSPRKINPALLKPYKPSAALAEIVGPNPLPRSQAVKKLWVYIKAHGLQDTKNKRMINADDKLRAIFNGNSQVSMFDMAKHLSKHLS